MSFKPTKYFKIVTFNCNGLKSSISYISKLLMENDIIFLNEHLLQVGEISSVNGLFSDDVCFLKSSVNPELLKGRPYGGVGFICRLQMALLFSSVPCDNITATIGQAFSQVKRRKWRPDVTILGRFLGIFGNTVLPQTTELNNLWYMKRPFSYRSYLLYEFFI